MKQFLTGLMFFVVVFYACNNFTDEAVKYNDYIITKQERIVMLFNKLDSSFADTLGKSFVTNYEILLSEVELQMKQVDSIPPFNGSNEFKEQYKLLLQAYHNVLLDEYKKMVEWYSLPDTLFTQQIADSFKKSYEMANQKISRALNQFIQFQNKFANEYNFTLIKN